MQRTSTFLWIIFAFLLLLPTSFGRVLLDLAGGLMLASLLIPLLLAGLGWIAWKVLQSKMITCEACGARLMQDINSCPICGNTISSQSYESKSSEEKSIPASSATIDIVAEELDQND